MSDPTPSITSAPSTSSTTSAYRPPRRRRDRMRAAVILGIAGVVVGAVLVALVTVLAAKQPDKVNLGDDTFVVGDAKRLAGHVPLLFKDPLTSKPGREVYVQHVGPDHRKGWLAVEAYAPGSPRQLRCILQWDGRGRVFHDPCSSATFPADGAGLRRYPVSVNRDGDVEVNLRRTAA